MSTSVMGAPPEAKPKATWKDFTLDEHLRGFVGVPEGCVFKAKKVGDECWRINIIDLENEKYVTSRFVRVTETPDGYVFKDLTSNTPIRVNARLAGLLSSQD